MTVSLLAASGCATPSPEEINTTYTDLEERTKSLADYQLARCEEVYSGHPAGIATCQFDVLQWEFQQLRKLEDARTDALEKRWRKAYEAKKQLEKDLGDLIPEFPQLSPLLEKLRLINMLLSPDGTEARMFPQVVASSSGPISFPVPVDTQRYAVSGTVEIDLADGTVVTGVATGSVHVYPDEDGDGVAGRVLDANFDIVFAEGSVHYTINKSATNRLDTDGGGGLLDIGLECEYSDERWSAVLPYLDRFDLPISLGAGGDLTINAHADDLADVAQYAPSPNSDYNLDGVLEYASDSAAFMAAFSVNDPRADIDNDGAWTADDIAEWTARFQEDVANGL